MVVSLARKPFPWYKTMPTNILYAPWDSKAVFTVVQLDKTSMELLGLTVSQLFVDGTGRCPSVDNAKCLIILNEVDQPCSCLVPICLKVRWIIKQFPSKIGDFLVELISCHATTNLVYFLKIQYHVHTITGGGTGRRNRNVIIIRCSHGSKPFSNYFGTARPP